MKTTRIPKRSLLGRSRRSFAMTAAALGLLASLLVDSAVAQEPAETPADQAPAADVPQVVTPPPAGIEAITISGESLDATNVQDEAQAITAFDTGELDRLSISNVDGLSLNVPGLHVGQQGQQAIITLRGVGTENASLTGEPGVAFHVDGIYYGQPSAARPAFFDVQAIEVKRGPQGLIGGKNSTSGAINVLTNDPTSEYEVRSDVLFGNYDRFRMRGHVNAPLGGEFAAARLALFYEQRDGYLDNVNFSDSQDPFDVDNFGLRGKLRFTPSETVNLVLGYNYFKETGNGPQADLIPLAPQGCGVDPRIPADFVSQMPVLGACRVADPIPSIPGDEFHFPVQEDTDPRKTWTEFESGQDDRYWGFSGKMDWDAPELPVFGASTLKLLGGYQRTQTAFDWDFDGSSQEFFNLFVDNVVHEYSSELQWSGETDKALSWQASLFFQRQTGDSRVLSPGLDHTPDLTGAEPPIVPNFANYQRYFETVTYDAEQSIENKSYGAALHGTYAFTDRLSFNLGGRWIKDHKETFLAQRNLTIFEACAPQIGNQEYQLAPRNPNIPVQLTPSGIAEPLPDCSLTNRGTMWGSRLEWRPADDHLLYAGIDRGYKSGGFASGGIGTYKPERIWAYTLGSKSEFLDQRLQVNLEGFVYNYEDMQLALLDGAKIRTENSDAQMYGWELEMRSSPIDGLRLQGLVAYLHTETKDYFTLDTASLNDSQLTTRLIMRATAERRGMAFPGNFVCITRPRTLCSRLGDKNGRDDYSGHDLSRSPQLKWNISGEYDVPLGRFGTLTPGIQYAWQDEAFYRVFARDFDKQESFHETNLRLTWSSPEQMWEAEAFVNNVEDDAVKQNILVGPGNFGSPPLAWYSEPRFYGFRLGFKY